MIQLLLVLMHDARVTREHRVIEPSTFTYSYTVRYCGLHTIRYSFARVALFANTAIGG